MPDGSYDDALAGLFMEVKNGRSVFKLAPMKSALFVARASGGSTGEVAPDEEKQGDEQEAQ